MNNSSHRGHRGHIIASGSERYVSPDMRILFAESGSGVGGSAKFLNEMIPYLDPEKFQAEVVGAGMGPFVQRIQDEGYTVHIKPQWNFPRFKAAPEKNAMLRYAALLGSLLYQFLFTVPGIALWLRKRKFDLVHLNNEVLSQIPLLLGAKLAGCKVLCHLQGWRPFTRIELWAIKFIDQITCLSNTGAKHFQDMLGGKVSVIGIPHALDMKRIPERESKRRSAREALGLGPDDIALCIMGRIISWKGQEIYLKALAQVKQRYPQVRGLVVGRDMSPEGDYLDKLKAMSAELGLDGNVRFMEFQDDVWNLYMGSDVIVHASTEPEPFGLVILEAMGAGSPVIATRAGGVPDMLHDEYAGMLVEPKSVEEMAQAMEKLVGDRALRERLGRQARERVEAEFTMEQNAERFVKVYALLIE